jgi:hypothetical protein
MKVARMGLTRSCRWKGECGPMPICHECGRCGLHCTCLEPGSAAIMAGRVAAVAASRKDSVVALQPEAVRLRKRWSDMKRRLDRAIGKAQGLRAEVVRIRADMEDQ